MNRFKISAPWIRSMLAVLVLVSLAGCKKGEPPLTEKGNSETPPIPEVKTVVKQAAPTKKSAPSLPPEIVLKDAGFINPGSVIVDSESGVYLVSNAGLAPTAAENKGFISKVSRDGKLIELKWIASGKNSAVLVSPKGMAIKGDTLYVVDVNTIRKFNRSTGKPLGDIPVPNAAYLNDIAVSDDGMLYVTDTGLSPLEGHLAGNGKDCIYRVDQNDQVTELIRSTDLKQPNGLLIDEDGFYVVSFSIPVLLHVSGQGAVEEVSKMPGDRLDGIVRLSDGRLAVSSWRSSAVYVGPPQGPFTAIREELSGPGDLAFDAERDSLVIPAAKDNAIHIQPLPKSAKSGDDVTEKRELTV